MVALVQHHRMVACCYWSMAVVVYCYREALARRCPLLVLVARFRRVVRVCCWVPAVLVVCGHWVSEVVRPCLVGAALVAVERGYLGVAVALHPCLVAGAIGCYWAGGHLGFPGAPVMLPHHRTMAV